MGVWSHEPFGNDDAGDWVSELADHGDFAFLCASVDAAADLDGQRLEAPQCWRALAAAEVVAAMLGRPCPSMPDEAVKWIKAAPGAHRALVESARSAVKFVLADSELRELWSESEDFQKWTGACADLLTRLS